MVHPGWVCLLQSLLLLARARQSRGPAGACPLRGKVSGERGGGAGPPSPRGSSGWGRLSCGRAVRERRGPGVLRPRVQAPPRFGRGCDGGLSAAALAPESAPCEEPPPGRRRCCRRKVREQRAPRGDGRLASCFIRAWWDRFRTAVPVAFQQKCGDGLCGVLFVLSLHRSACCELHGLPSPGGRSAAEGCLLLVILRPM